MATKKTTYYHLQQFWGTAQAWVAEHDPLDSPQAIPKTKLGYAIKQVGKQVERLFQKYNAKRERINISHAACDEGGYLLMESDLVTYRFKPEKKIARNDAWDELMFETEIEVKPYYATDLPNNLTEDELEAFAGFVIEEKAAAAGESHED